MNLTRSEFDSRPGSSPGTNGSSPGTNELCSRTETAATPQPSCFAQSQTATEPSPHPVFKGICDEQHLNKTHERSRDYARDDECGYCPGSSPGTNGSSPGTNGSSPRTPNSQTKQNPTDFRIADFWHTVGDRVQCDLCPRECRMREGQHGFCFIRQNVGGQLVQLAYGKLSGLSADPIEKKPLYHFYPGSLALSFGTAGCNLACKFCQNWGISKAKRMQILSQDAPPDDIARLAKHFGCRSVAYTYNDPIVFAEYAIDTAQACRDAGIANVAVSAGYISKQARGPFFSPMDAANIDLKSFNPDFYRKVTGAELSVVLDNLAWLRSTPVRLEITTLLIPGMNDSDSEILALTKWVRDNLSADVPLHFSAFHPAYRMQDVGRTPPSTVRRARELALDVGLEYVYTGNIADTEGSTTYCPACGATVIARDGYRVTVNNLVDNCCPACGKRIPGRFSQADAALGT